MTISAQTFVCDRDGVEAVGDQQGKSFPNEPPAGWTQFNIAGRPPIQPVAGHLCPNCTQAFEEFMEATASPTQARRPVAARSDTAATLTPPQRR